MSPPRQPPPIERTGRPTPADRERLDAVTARARAVADAAARQPEGSVHETRHGTVHLGPVRLVEPTDDAPAVIEVYARGQTVGGDPHFRVVNPPRYVPDPEGPVEINGHRFRDDPLAALADVIARNGGARKRGRGR